MKSSLSQAQIQTLNASSSYIVHHLSLIATANTCTHLFLLFKIGPTTRFFSPSDPHFPRAFSLSAFAETEIHTEEPMCLNSEMIPFSPLYSAFRLRRPSKHNNFRVRRLINRRRSICKSSTKEAKEKEMEIKNLKLYMENKSIIEENNKLRRKALVLVQENQALFSQLQQKLSQNSMHAPLP